MSVFAGLNETNIQHIPYRPLLNDSDNLTTHDYVNYDGHHFYYGNDSNDALYTLIKNVGVIGLQVSLSKIIDVVLIYSNSVSCNKVA